MCRAVDSQREVVSPLLFFEALIFFVFQFLNVPMFRNVTLKCLTEIAGVSVNQYEEQFVSLFTLTMCQLKQVLSLTCTHTQSPYSS